MHVTYLELTHADDHLVELSESLLALVPLKLAPEFKLVVDNLQGGRVVLGQLDLLPQLVG